MPPTPLTAIAQTPRKEPESKFTFNPVLAKVRTRRLFTRHGQTRLYSLAQGIS